MWQEIKDYLTILVALIIYLFAYFGFIYANEITSGGLAGISSVITWGFNKWGSWGANVEFWMPYNLINGILIIVALKVIGIRFMLKTVFSVVILAMGTPTVEKYILPMIKDSLPLQNDPFLAVVLGSVLIGLSLGIVFSVGGSTGGTDIVATIINKYKQISIGRALIYIDVITLGASWFIFKSPDKLVYSIVQVLITNSAVDYFLNGSRQSMQFFIISKHYQEIADAILKKVNRGVTLINGEGAYTHSEVKIVMVIARKTESVNIFRTVKEVDPNAFITQTLVRGVYGQGFDVIKVNNKKKVLAKAPDGVAQKEPVNESVNESAS